MPSPPSTATLDTTTTANRRFPSDLKTIKCSYPNCPKTFNRPARLAAHLRSHTNDRPFKCPFPDCDKDYLEEKHLKQHVKGSHTHERSYACEEPNCGKAFVTATRLRRHAAVHAGKERYRCRGYDGCEQSFRKHQTLQRHVRTEHLGMPAYPCQQEGCGRGFDSAGAMKRHVEREHGELRFWCDECGVAAADDEDEEEEEYGGKPAGSGRGNGGRVGFTTMTLLQAHLKKEHVNCIFCDVRCGSQAQLDRHVEMYHSTTSVQDRKTVACEWPGCPKTFTLRKNLNAHVKTAHQGFRFVCGEVDTFGTSDISDWNWAEEGCGEGFISKLKLEEHVRFVHLGRKRPKKVYAVGDENDGDYIAAVSGVSDATKRNIPCAVPGCEARFIRHHDLTVHLRNQHGGEGLMFRVQQQVLEVPAVAGYGEQEEVLPSSLAGEQVNTPPEQVPPHAAGFGDEVYVDPDLQAGEEFWFGAGGSDLHQDAGREFEREWADMRRLIDIDALVDEKPSAC